MQNHTNMNINALSKDEIIKKLEDCPINFAMRMIGGKWKPVILHRIKIGINRFGQLQKAIPLISKQMLTAQLRELEEDNILVRKVYAEVPPKVEYSISKNGETLFPLLEAIENWGKSQQELLKMAKS
jgi:DNA-binding HxlR family transcriptional regulator